MAKFERHFPEIHKSVLKFFSQSAFLGKLSQETVYAILTFHQHVAVFCVEAFSQNYLLEQCGMCHSKTQGLKPVV